MVSIVSGFEFLVSSFWLLADGFKGQVLKVKGKSPKVKDLKNS